MADRVSDERRSRLQSHGPVRDRARLICQNGGFANAWMKALPCKALRTDIPDREYRLLLRWWLGVAILPTTAPLPGCTLCGEPVDPFGDHLICCARNGCTRQHTSLRDAFFGTLVSAGIPAAREVACQGREHPADVLLVAWEKGRDVAVDFMVSHPLGLADHPLNLKKGRPSWSPHRNKEGKERRRHLPKCW